MDSLDVKYTVSGGSDQRLDPDLVTLHQDMAPCGRRSRQKFHQLPSSSDGPDPKAATEGDIENEPNSSQPPRGAHSRSVRKPKAKKKRTPTKQQQQSLSKLKSPTFARSSGAVQKQLQRLSSLISPNQKSQQGQQPTFFSPETAYAQNHRRRPIPSDIPSDVVCYADAGDSSPGSDISMCAFPSLLDDSAPSTARTIIRSASRLEVCDTSMDVEDELDDSDDDRKTSPTFARLMEARIMAAGHSNLSPSLLEKIPISATAKAAVHQDSDDIDSLGSSRESDGTQEPRARLTLRDVWDDSYKKASKFIGDVVSGADCGTTSSGKDEQPAPPSKTFEHDSMEGNKTDNNSKNKERMHQFCTRLHDVLLNSDGMIEATEVSRQISGYTQQEVDEFLASLATQNKIMHTDGWIYNI